MSGVDPIRGFLAAVRRRLILRTGLQTAGYGAALLGAAWRCSRSRRRRPAPRRSGPSSRRACWARPRWPSSRGASGGRRARCARIGRRPARRACCCRRWPAICCPPSSWPSRASRIRARPPCPRAWCRRFRNTSGVRWRPSMRASWCRCARRRARSPTALLAGAALAAGAWWSPMFARGLRTLIHRPSLFEGAAVSTVPLVGDVRITYSYPAYTGLPPRTVEGSTGDIAAVKGTRVRIETHPLRSARRALLLLGEHGEKGEIAAKLTGDRAGRRADGLGGRELPVLAAADVRPRRARGAQPPPDRRGRQRAAGRDPGPGGPAGAGDAATDRDRVFGQRRLRAGHRRAGHARRRPPGAADAAARRQRRARGAGAHAVGSGDGRAQRRRAHRVSHRGARSRRRLGRPERQAGHRRARCTSSSRTRTRAWRIGWSASASCWRS